MRKILFFILCLSILIPTPVHAWRHRAHRLQDNVEAYVYSYRKTEDYIAVEMGLFNPTSDYISFTADEIYLNDREGYYVPPMPYQILEEIFPATKVDPYVPYVYGTSMRIGSVSSGIPINKISRGDSLAALGMGEGDFVLSQRLLKKARENQIIGFKKNALPRIDRLPPLMAVGGYLYFPAVRNPISVTIVSKTQAGITQTKTISLKRMYKPREPVAVQPAI